MMRMAVIAIVVALATPAPDAVARERITFKSNDGTPLTGFLYRPESPGPHPAVIMMHGCAGLVTKRGALKRRERTWAYLLKRKGYVVLLVDSFSPRGHRSICGKRDRPIEPDRERPHDAYGALRWLQSKPFVRPDRIALAGWSNGAMAMLWTINEGAEQRPNDLVHGFRAAVGFYPGCIRIRREGFKATVPALLQVGLADNWTLAKPCLAMVAENNEEGGAAMEIDAYEGAYHAFDHPDLPARRRLARHSGFRDGEKQVWIGTNREARRTAIARVMAYLRAALRD